MKTGHLITAAMLLVVAAACRDDTSVPVEPSATSPQPSAAVSAWLSFWQLSSGQYHSCGVTVDYHAYCWGYDASGQLGDGGLVGSIDQPFPVQGGLSFKQIDAGGYHTCAVTPGNRGYCWGEGGLVGNGTTTRTSLPRAVAGSHVFRQVSVGLFHSCAVTTDSRIYCWGYNTYGQLGDGTTSGRLRPVAVLGSLAFKQVSAGGQHTCAVTTDDRAYCWGSNQYGQVGDSSTAAKRLRPVRVRTTLRLRQIDAGINHSCAVTRDDRAFCWGRNGSGQLGDGTTTLRRWPRAVAGGLSIDRVTAGGGHTCGESAGNRAYCWGDNFYGGLGNGTTTNRLRPVAVAGGLYFAQLSAGIRNRTCGKTSAGVGYCWGDDWEGALGDGNGYEMQTSVPTLIGPPY